MRVGAIAIVLTTAATAASALASVPRTPLARDVQGYAIAACLAAQKDAVFKEQGEGWAEAIVQRGHGDPAALRGVDRAVEKAMALVPLAVVHRDGPVASDVALPVMYCSEIVDRATVRVAIDRAIVALAPAYRRR